MGKRHRGGASRLAAGGVLILLGFFLIMANLGFLEGFSLWKIWPVILIILGIVRMTNAPKRPGPPDGTWLLVIGLWAQWSVLRLFDLGFGDTWPVLVIAWGIGILWEALDRRALAATPTEVTHE